MASHNGSTDKRLRSRRWFDDPSDPAMTALYLERFMNYGITPRRTARGKPIIGIAQTGSRLLAVQPASPGPRQRIRDGIRDAGGIRWNSRCIRSTRPATARRRRWTATWPIWGLVEILHGYPHGRGGADHRLRQDDARLPDGRGDGEHSRHRAVRRPDAGRLVAGTLSGSGTIVWEGRRCTPRARSATTSS